MHWILDAGDLWVLDLALCHHRAFREPRMLTWGRHTFPCPVIERGQKSSLRPPLVIRIVEQFLGWVVRRRPRARAVLRASDQIYAHVRRIRQVFETVHRGMPKGSDSATVPILRTAL